MKFKTGDRVRYTAKAPLSYLSLKGLVAIVVTSQKTWSGSHRYLLVDQRGQPVGLNHCREDNLELAVVTPFEQSLRDYINLELNL